MHQQLWRYKLEEKIYLGVRERKSLNTIGIAYRRVLTESGPCVVRGSEATTGVLSENQVNIHLKSENMTDVAD